MSVGVSMGVSQDKIFTGWDYADTSTAAASYDGTVPPKLAIREPITPFVIDPEVPTIVRVS